MARIKREDHPRILRLVDVERRAIREIAGEFGCTPAAIYSLLTKLRREASGVASEPVEDQPPLALGEEVEPEFLNPSASPPPATAVIQSPREQPLVVTLERPAQPPVRAEVRHTAAVQAPVPVREEARRPGQATVGAKLAKPGMGLLMRTSDGEETMTPFRSIDDLLSAIKPILRAGARSPEPVWFSLQAVDLSAIDLDAA